MIPNARSLLHRYLLEEATEEEKLQVEIRSAADNVYRERLQAAGQELIAAYVAELLTGAKRERVEKYFLRSEERLEKLRFAQLLCEYARSSGPKSPGAGDPLYHYLIGEATDEEKLQIEEKLLADDDYKRRLEIVECALIAAYVLDSLTEDDRERFERYFLSSEERVEKVRLAEVICEYYDYIEERVAQDGAGARWFDRLQRWLAEPVSV
jgi:hypothetical protein